MDCRIIILAIVALSVNVNGLANITDCAPGSQYGRLIKADIPDCNPPHRECHFKYNHYIKTKLHFESETKVTTVMQKVHATGIGHPTEIFFKRDACIGVGLDCPLSAGNHTYSYALYMADVFPEGKYHFQFHLMTENLEDIICIALEVVVEE